MQPCRDLQWLFLFYYQNMLIFHQICTCLVNYWSKVLTWIFGDTATVKCSEDLCDKQEAHAFRSAILWQRHLKFRKEWAKKTDTFLFCKVSQQKIFFHNAKSCHFFSFCFAHFYGLLSNFPFKILFLPSTGHHPQKYHIHPSSDWIFEWLFWSLALSPWSLISRDQQTGSYNLQTGLNHNLTLRKCF